MAVWTVGAREANQQFSTLLAAAERDGDTIVITRRGKPVARLVPERPVNRQGSAKAIDALIKRFARPGGGERVDRESLYDRAILRRP